MEPTEQKKCHPSRKIKNYKLSKTKQKQYWNNVFNKIDREFQIPLSQRFEYSYNLLDDEVYNKISKLFRFLPDPRAKYQIPLENIVSQQNINLESSVFQMPLDNKRFESTKLGTLPSIYQLRRLRDKRLHKQKVGVSEEEILPRKNPFITFLKKDDAEARIWRPKPAIDVMSQPLVKRSDLVVNNITTEFCDWLRSLGESATPINLNEKTIKSMFHVGTNEFATKSLRVEFKEIASVPHQIAEAIEIPEVSEQTILRNHLINDIKAERSKKRTTGFSRSLSPNRQFVPPTNSTYKRWIKCSHVPNDIKTFEHVWKNITHISSVRYYCQWLCDHPNVFRPKYLKDLGLINKDYWKARESVDTQDSITFSENLLADMNNINWKTD